MNTKIISLFLGIFFFTSCINEDLNPCPPTKGNVKINLYVEKFQNKSLDPLVSREAAFNKRLHYMCYYLYKGDSLLEHGIESDLTTRTAPAFIFEHHDLDFGDYTLVIGGNCPTQGILTGTGLKREELMFNYPLTGSLEDYFACVFPFTVNCDCTQEYDAGLQRVLGVVRCNFVNLPDDISEVEISLNGLTCKKAFTSDYAEETEITKHFPVHRSLRSSNQSYSMGTFPTIAGKRTAYRLRLYSSGKETPVFEQVMTDTLQVARNQLLELVTTFGADGIKGQNRFEVFLDKDWNGSVDGGNTNIH